MENKICTTTTIKASLNDTLNFINYHLNIGIDHMYVFFDDPNDDAIDVLSPYANVSCFKCNSSHWKKLKNQNNLMEIFSCAEDDKKQLCLEERQQLNANYALKLAREGGYDWIVHMDSDELIYLDGNLKETLSKIKKSTDVLRIFSVEAVPEKMNYENNLQEISLFKSFGWISRFYYENKKLLQKYVPYLKRNEGKLKIRTMYFSGHATGKSIVSTGARIKNIGMHEPISKDGHNLSIAFSKEILLLHFECRNFKDWIKKWEKVCNNPKDTVGYDYERVPFLKEFIIAHKNNDAKRLARLYRSIYFISWDKKLILRSLGLLKRIRLDKKLFLKSKNL